MSDTPNLTTAYALRTSRDAKRLYGDWAKTYDAEFAADMDYQLPVRVAEAFIDVGGKGSVLDIGAGTGLAGFALHSLGIGSIDATDISQEMLDIAEKKQLYRRLFIGDMTTRLPVSDNTYHGVISSGTFTTGHVGPEALNEVLRVANRGAQIAISVSAAHFLDQGFGAKFEQLENRITDFTLRDVPIYGPDNTTDHRDDVGRIALFKKV